MNLAVSQEHDDREDLRTVTKYLDEERSVPKKFDRNEKLFIHCLAVFMISFRCFIEVDEKLYHKKFHHFLEYMISLCNLPFFDVKRREVLLQESEKNAFRYNYFLELYIIYTSGIDSLASRRNEDKVFVRVEWKEKHKICFKNHELFPTRHHGWMPSYDWVTKTFSRMVMKINSNLIDKNNEFNIYLLIRSSRTDKLGSLLSVFPLGVHRLMGQTKKIPILKFTPTEITWSGLQRAFQCNEVTLCIRIKWTYQKYALKRDNMNMIQQLFEQFLRYEWRRRSPYQMFSVKCTGGNKNGFCINETLLSDEIWYQRDPFWRKPLDLPELVSNPFCTCSLWCNINSFYFYNPIAVFLLSQTQRIYNIPYARIIPYHFKALCKLIEEKNFVCFSLLSSLLKSLYYYLKDFYSQNQEFTYSRCIEIIQEGYFYLRKFLVKPDSFKSCRKPFDEYEKEFKFFIQAMIWLSISIRGLNDRKLSKRLRYKFQDVIISWINTVLDNPSDNISSTIVTFEFTSENEDLNFSYGKISYEDDFIPHLKQTVLELNDYDHSFFEPSFESLWDFDKDLFDEAMGLYNVGLNKKANKTSYINNNDNKINLICSKHLSLLHRVNDFLLNVAPLVPFDFYDKRLYKIEVVMICQLDAELKTRTNYSDYYVKIAGEENSISLQLKTTAIKHYTILLYSIAYNIQNFIMERQLFTFYKEFNLQLSINRIKFFSTNEWIENITACNDLKPLFRNINATKTLLEYWFQLYQSYWNLPAQKNLSLDENSITRSLAYECISIGYWIKHKKDHEKILRQRMNKFIKILNNYQKDLKDNIETFTNKNRQKLIDKTAKIPIQQLEYCFKAYCFNMLCLSINLIQHFDNLFSDLHKRFGFILLCPLWIELLQLNNAFSSSLQTSITLLPNDINLKEKVKTFSFQTIKNINITIEDIFIKLSRKLIQEIHYLVFMYKNKNRRNIEMIQKKEEEVPLSMHIVRLMILYGYGSLSRFKSQFDAGHSLLNEKLQELSEVDPFIKELIYNINEDKLSFYSSPWITIFEDEVNIFNQKFPTMLQLISQWKPNEPRPTLEY